MNSQADLSSNHVCVEIINVSLKLVTSYDICAIYIIQQYSPLCLRCQ